MALFPDLASAEERTRRLTAILERAATLTPDQLKQVESSLKAQALIETSCSASNIPVQGADPSALQSAMAGKAELIRNNLTSLLGYAPEPSDIAELQKLRSTMGSEFTSKVKQLGSVVTQVEGGINSVLSSIEQGVMGTIDSVISQGQALINSAVKDAENAIRGLLPDPKSLLPVEMQAAIDEARRTAKEVTGAVNDTINTVTSAVDSALNEITSAINDITSGVTGTINRAIDDVNQELNSISKDLQNQARGFVDSNITGPLKEQLNNTVTTAVTAPPIPPTPITPTGEPFPAAAPPPQPADNPAPIVPPRAQAQQGADGIDYSPLEPYERAKSELISELRRSGRSGDAWSVGGDIRDPRILDRMTPVERQAYLDFRQLQNANRQRAALGLPPLRRLGG